MFRVGVVLCIFFVSGLLSQCQINPKSSFTKAELEEFELLNLCHCLEYLNLRHYDYVKFNSDEAKKKYLEELKYIRFGQYLSIRRHSQYYQTKYDSSLFLKDGVSLVFGSELNFGRLDSLYYEPIVQHYVREESKTVNLPYLGLGDNFFFMDCFYKIKEIPLEQELEYFISVNQKD